MAAQMLGSSTTTGTMPRVNLLPPEIAERVAARRAHVAMVGVGLAAVAVVGVMYVNANGKVSEATEAKAAAAEEGTRLDSELRTLQNVRDVYAKVDAARATLASAMATEVLWSSFLHDMTLTIPENVWLTDYSVSVPHPFSAAAAPAGAAAPSGGVFESGIGTVTISGAAISHNDVAAWLESLAKQKGYANPYFTKSAEKDLGGRVIFEFNSTVTLTPAALSNRYTKGPAR